MNKLKLYKAKQVKYTSSLACKLDHTYGFKVMAGKIENMSCYFKRSGLKETAKAIVDKERLAIVRVINVHDVFTVSNYFKLGICSLVDLSNLSIEEQRVWKAKIEVMLYYKGGKLVCIGDNAYAVAPKEVQITDLSAKSKIYRLK